jgi:[acyl-carrier-protein] S-malonyltransferase
MQEAVPAGQGAMAAILALAADQVRAACEEAAQGEVCQPANINSPDQVVISGNKAAVERAAEICKAKGAKRAVMLPVSAPFHCALMQPARDRLAVDLQALQFEDPAVPVMCNVDAAPVTTADAARNALIRQVTGAVRWYESIRNLIASGIGDFVEVGPGKVLTGLMRQIDRTPHATNVEDEASLQKTKNHFAESTSKPE